MLQGAVEDKPMVAFLRLYPDQLNSIIFFELNCWGFLHVGLETTRAVCNLAKGTRSIILDHLQYLNKHHIDQKFVFFLQFVSYLYSQGTLFVHLSVEEVLGEHSVKACPPHISFYPFRGKIYLFISVVINFIASIVLL